MPVDDFSRECIENRNLSAARPPCKLIS
jgi:hypothetical protein